VKPHLHKILNLLSGDVLSVHADTPIFVFFADDTNYDAYLNEFDFEYYGSAVESFPFFIAPVRPGRWHVVVEQTNPEKDLNVRLEIVPERSLK